MTQLSPEEKEAIKDAPKGTYALMLVTAAAITAGWLYMFYFMFLPHGPIS